MEVVDAVFSSPGLSTFSYTELYDKGRGGEQKREEIANEMEATTAVYHISILLLFPFHVGNWKENSDTRAIAEKIVILKGRIKGCSAVREWLDELRDALYVVDDLLDEMKLESTLEAAAQVRLLESP